MDEFGDDLMLRHGDLWEELNEACQELTNVVAKFASSTVSDLSEAFRQFNISTKA